MKKFFSLLCATLLVFSASAAPVAKKAQLAKQAPVAVEQMQKVQFEKAQSEKIVSLENIQLSNQLTAAPAMKVSNQKAPAQVVRANKLQKAQNPAVRRTAQTAKAVAKAPQNTAITIGSFSASSAYEGEYYVIMTDAASSTQFIFDIETTSFELGKTYTLADMILEYTGIGDANDWYAWESVTAATYTETKDEKGLTHVVASMTDTKGTVYDITYDEEEPQVHNVIAADFSIQDYGTDMYIVILDSVGNTYYFDVLYTGSFEFGKTYALAEMDPDYSWMKFANGAQAKYSDASVTVSKDAKDLTHIAAQAKLTDGNTYNITFDEKEFVPSGTKINVAGTDLNGRYMSYYGFYLYTATWGDYTVQLAFDAEEEKASYTNEEFIANYGLIYETEGDEEIYFEKLASDNITITNTETTKTLAGSIYAKNGDEYILNLVYEKPAVETATAIVEDAKLTKTSQFFHVDGNDTEGAYGVTLYVYTKNLEGEFTVEDLDSWSSGVTELSTKKWFDIDSCEIVSEMLGSNTLVISGLLHTSNTQLGRLIDLTFIMTARVDANGELMDIYGGIVAPAKGDTLSFNRAKTGVAFFKSSSGGLSYGAQSGKATIVAVNDSAYYWYNPLSKFTTGYWVKGLKDKQANTINFEGSQVINVYNGGLLGLMQWLKITTEGKISVLDDAPFVLEIKEDTLTLKDSDPFDFSKDVNMAGVVVPGYGFQGYGDCGTVLTLNKPITERDTVDVVTTFMRVDDFVEDMGVAQLWVGADYLQTTGDIQFSVTIQNTESLTGTFSFAENTLMNDFTLIINSEGEKTFFQNGEVTITNDEYPILKGWLIGDDEKYYRLDWSKKPIEKRDTLRFSGKGVTISECVNSQTQVQTGWFYELTDASTGYEFLLQSTVVANKYGTFSYEDKTLGSNYYNVFDPQGNRQQFVEGSITVGEVGDSIVLDGELIAKDEKVYILHFAQANTVLNYDTDAPFEAEFKYYQMEASIDNGVIGIYATNAEGLTIGLELYADPAATTIPAGTYVISDTQEAGTALQSLGVVGGYLTECWAGVRTATGISDCWFIVEGSVTLSYDEYGKLKVVVDAKNSYGQPVTALVQYEKLEPKSTVTITDAEFSIYEGYLEQYGIMNFYGENADEFEFDLYAYADTVAGDFLEAIDFGDCELTLADGSHVGVIDAYEFKVERDGKNLTLTAKVLGTDTVQYNITATGYFGALPYDSNEDYAGEFAIEEVTFSQQKAKKLVTITGTNDAKFVIVLQNAVLTDGVLAAGEYTDVQASTGVNEDYSINPSYAMNADGAAWFIQSGKLTVAQDGSMLFEGLNSYDKNVVITITVPAPAVTDYYLVGWINGAAYGIEGDIDNFGDYHFVDGKVKATFNEMSYVQVKDNNKQIYGTASYVVPAAEGTSAVVSATGTEKMGIDGNVEFEYTLTIAEDGTLTLSYAPTTVDLRNAKANVKAAKRIDNGQIVIVRDNKEYNILGSAL